MNRRSVCFEDLLLLLSFNHAYDLGRPVEVKFACESLRQNDALAMDGRGGEDARVEDGLAGEAGEARAHGVAQYSGCAC